ncbi:pertactin autotransporter [Bordetella pertussis]|uniref:pertactin autotransporter n=1 Tax=Bordetella pertussis TaxID=520 RepID=UPI002E30E3E3|nr:pertactin autotransporter [Bordetella pertussis]
MNMSLSRIVKAAPLRRTTLAMALGALGAAPAAHADWNNQSIVKTGERQHGIHIQGSDPGGVRTASGTTIKVSGRQAQGILLENPAAELQFRNGSVTSSGQLSDDGIRRFLGTVTVKAGKLVADHATLANVGDTWDDDGIALYVAGEQAQASIADSTLQGAGGVQIERGANVTVQRSAIVDGGLHIGALQSLQPEDLPPSRVVLRDTNVTAVPASGAPAAVSVLGASELTLDGGHITGGRAAGVAAMQGAVVHLQRATIRRGDAPAGGAVPGGAVPGGAVPGGAVPGGFGPGGFGPVLDGWYGVDVSGSSVELAQSIVEAPELGAAIRVGRGARVTVSGGSLSAPHGNVIETGGARRFAPQAAPLSITLQAGAHAQGKALLYRVLPEPVKLTLTGGADAQGDIVATELPSIPGTSIGPLDVALASQARWTGATRAVDSLSIDNATWVMTDNSNVGALRLASDGSVDFQQPAEAGRFKVLTVNTLAGSGLFRMNVFADLGLSDKLVVMQDASGQHRLWVRNSGSEPASANTLLLVQTPRGSAATFTLANKDGKVDIGTYRYRLAANGNGQWSLVGAKAPPAPKPAPQPGPQPPQPQPEAPAPQPPAGRELSAAANAAVNTGGVGLASTLWYAESNALSKRLGELRLNPDAGGAWGRGFAQRQQLDNRAGRRFDQKVAGFELGADHAVAVAGGRWHLGGLAGYTRGDRGFTGDGGGHTDSVHVGGYATYIADSGFYLDATLRASRLENDFKVAGSDGYAVKGKYRTHGVGASLEAGRRFTHADGWFLEPQAELAVFRAGGGAYRAANGLRVRDEGGSSVLGRLGLEVGKRIELAGGRQVQPYIKASVLQEFDGAGTVHTNGIAHRTELRGTRAELGLGMAAALGRGHSLYASYEYSKGPKLAMPWTFHAGYRYSW